MLLRFVQTRHVAVSGSWMAATSDVNSLDACAKRRRAEGPSAKVPFVRTRLDVICRQSIRVSYDDKAELPLFR
jgi:hypothetical protein